MFKFTITATDPHSSARTGVFHTPHGSFHTPCFMPCGTKAAVKTLTPDELKSLGCKIVLANTYHLMLRPGGGLIERMGGLHKWMGWNNPILTDSGGFQVFSLQRINFLSSAPAEPDASRSRRALASIDDEGVIFKSHIDGSTHFLTPEKSIEIQEQLGADIIMAFDECPPATADHAYAKLAMRRTHDWLKRSLKAKKRNDQILFPIIQGSIYPDLRRESAKIAFEAATLGIAIGGIAVGESKEDMWKVVETVMPLLPKNQPRYLMGIGEPEDIVKAISLGIDMFDCVLPTRLARHGSFWTAEGRRSITNSEFTMSNAPLEKRCACYTCQNFSASYLRHLMIEKEILGHRLLTIHNLHFLLDLMRDPFSFRAWNAQKNRALRYKIRRGKTSGHAGRTHMPRSSNKLLHSTGRKC